MVVVAQDVNKIQNANIKVNKFTEIKQLFERQRVQETVANKFLEVRTS